MIENCFSHSGNQCGEVSKKLKIDLPYDPAQPFLAICPKVSTLLYRYLLSSIHYPSVHNSKDMDTMQCPTNDELMAKNMVHIMVEYFLTIKKAEIMK